MKRVYATPDLLMAGHIRNLLQSAGIGCVLRNDMLAGGVGELPPTAVWPEVWITRDADAGRARELVRQALETPDAGAAWTCRRCGEVIEGQFGQCWNCGAPAPDGTD